MMRETRLFSGETAGNITKPNHGDPYMMPTPDPTVVLQLPTSTPPASDELPHVFVPFVAIAEMSA